MRDWGERTLRLLVGAGLVLAAADVRAQTPLEQLQAILNPAQAEEMAAESEGKAKPEATPIGVGENTGFEFSGGDRFEFHARNIDVAEALAQLRHLARRNIVVSPLVDERFTGDLYDVDTMEAINVICHSTDLIPTIDGQFIYIDPAELETRFFELEHARAEDLVTLIEPVLSEDGKVSGTIASEQGMLSFAVQESGGGDNYANVDVLVVKDYPRQLEKIAEIVASVDAQPRQVLVEATILTAEISDDTDVGSEITALFGANLRDAPGNSVNGTDLDLGPFPSDVLDDDINVASTNLTATLATSGLNLGIIEGGIGVFVRALQAITNTQVLANPKILTLNKQRGEVLLGRRDGFLTTTVTQTATIQSVEFLETGTRLIFRPFITKDGYVRLEIHPEDSDGGVNAEGLPFKETTEITTNIMVKSGETVVIGGLFRERVQIVQKKVPLLGDIPWLGWLFRSETERKLLEEIIIFLTPHIVDPAAPPEDDDLASAMPEEVEAAVTSDELAAAYVSSARTLLADGALGSAAYLLDSAEELGRRRREVEELQRRLWERLAPDPDATSVDDRILKSVLRAHDEESR